MFTSKGIILMCGFKENNNLKPHKNGRKELIFGENILYYDKNIAKYLYICKKISP